jgi:hypothetical protein
LTAAKVLDALEAQVADLPLAGAVVRLRFESIARDVYHGLDLAAVDDLFADCMHVVRSVGRTGLVTGGGPEESEVPFTVFARREMPGDVDAEAVVRLALGYLDDAAAEEAEAEAAG